MRMDIRWGDMDMMGHVNNTVYFRYIESAHIAWLEAAGGPPHPDGTGPVIINAHCTFLRQLTYPGQIEVKTYVGPPGRSSFEMTHEIRAIGPDGQAGEILNATGGAKIVWADIQAEKSVPLPDFVRSALA